jgi:hypothetical protein
MYIDLEIDLFIFYIFTESAGLLIYRRALGLLAGCSAA